MDRTEPMIPVTGATGGIGKGTAHPPAEQGVGEPKAAGERYHG